MVILSVTAETHARLTVMLWSVDTEGIAIKASVLYPSNPTIPADHQLMPVSYKNLTMTTNSRV